MNKKNIFKIRHLLDMETLNKEIINYLFTRADYFLKQVLEKNCILKTLEGKVITNLFFEPSTRSRNAFELAAKHLSGIVLSPDMETSSTVKGETLLDTIHTFEAMGTDLIVIRHTDNNTAQFIASEVNGSTSVINAGDGNNQHPTQGLLDLMTIKQHKSRFENLSVAIVGDIAHSRVARSLIAGLKIMGTKNIRIVAPKIFIPEDIDDLGITAYPKLADGLMNCDVVVALRIQKERMQKAAIPDPEKFYEQYGITPETIRYAKPDAIVMHPGPMNRNVEIDSRVADGKQSVILQQVRNGVAMRMAVMELLLSD